MSADPTVGADARALPRSIPAAAYVDDGIFELEQRRIFAALWIFVGMAQILERENSFLTRVVAGKPVLIQRLDGRLRAFENRCLHRQMPLQWEAMGERKLICKYHGWAYSSDGCVKAMANAQLYDLDPASAAAMCLREYPLRQVGNLLFVCVGDNPVEFESQFQPEFLDKIERASLAFDSEFAYTVFDVPWNWKLNFENVLDWNHIQFVHPKSFLPLLDPDGQRKIELADHSRELQRRLDCGAPIGLDSLSYQVHGPMAANTLAWAASVERFGELDDYYNWFLYPNINFCSVHGGMFLIQQFMPKSPTTTEYHLWVLTAKRRDLKTDHSGLLWSMIKGEKAVIDEDALALSQLQAKMTADAPHARHGAYESHILRMHRWYVDALGLHAQAKT